MYAPLLTAFDGVDDSIFNKDGEPNPSGGYTKGLGMLYELMLPA